MKTWLQYSAWPYSVLIVAWRLPAVACSSQYRPRLVRRARCVVAKAVLRNARQRAVVRVTRGRLFDLGLGQTTSHTLLRDSLIWIQRFRIGRPLPWRNHK